MLFIHCSVRNNEDRKVYSVEHILQEIRTTIIHRRILAVCYDNLPADGGQLYNRKQADEIINQVVEDSITRSGQ